MGETAAVYCHYGTKEGMEHIGDNFGHHRSLVFSPSRWFVHCAIGSTSVCSPSPALRRYTENGVLSLASAELSFMIITFPLAVQPPDTSFHSTVLPNLQVSLHSTLTTFEAGVSPWMHPSEWLDANTKHIRSLFDGIVDFTENADFKTITFPATMISQVCR